MQAQWQQANRNVKEGNVEGALSAFMVWNPFLIILIAL
jgi:hypothetical protein